MKPWNWRLQGEKTKKPLHYPECGLDDVYLLSGYEICQTPYGEGVTVKNLEGLHEAIGLRLATRKKMLSGKEVRFLRKQMDVTQSELGRLLGLDAQSVARWEKNETKIKGPSERLLRVLYLGKVVGAVDVEDLLKKLDEMDAPMIEKQVFKETDEGWRSAA